MEGGRERDGGPTGGKGRTFAEEEPKHARDVATRDCVTSLLASIENAVDELVSHLVELLVRARLLEDLEGLDACGHRQRVAREGARLVHCTRTRWAKNMVGVRGVGTSVGKQPRKRKGGAHQGRRGLAGKHCTGAPLPSSVLGPAGATISMISFLPAYAPTGKPPPMTLPNVERSGVMPQCC